MDYVKCQHKIGNNHAWVNSHFASFTEIRVLQVLSEQILVGVKYAYVTF